MASPYKSNEVPMVYLNKGQFYPITLHGMDSGVCLNVSKVKVYILLCIIMEMFGLMPQLHLQPFACDQASPSQVSVPPLALAKKH